MSDEYTEHLEKLVDELEQRAQLAAKVKQEAFLFRRMEKVLHQREVDCKSTLHDKHKQLDDVREGKYPSISTDSVRKSVDHHSGRLYEIENIIRDIRNTKEDMLNYDEDELLDPNFFNF